MKDLEKQYMRLCEDLPGNKGFCAANLKTGETIAYNAGWRINEPASTIKLPIMCAVLEQVQNGDRSLHDRLITKPEDKVGGCGILSELDGEISLTLQDYLTLMIIISDNTATNILIEAVGFSYINVFLVRKGFQDLYLGRKMFDSQAKKQGVKNYASPAELTQLLESIYNKTLLEEQYCNLILDILLKQQMNTKMPLKITDYWKTTETKVAHKTGDDAGVQHDTGIVFGPNCTFALTCMTTETVDELAVLWIADITKLLFDYFEQGGKTTV